MLLIHGSVYHIHFGNSALAVFHVSVWGRKELPMAHLLMECTGTFQRQTNYGGYHRGTCRTCQQFAQVQLNSLPMQGTSLAVLTFNNMMTITARKTSCSSDFAVASHNNKDIQHF